MAAATTGDTGEDVNTSAPSSSRLLSLPAELRNRIYRLILLTSGKIAVCGIDYKPPPVLQTNRQIRSEALKIFYEENKFYTCGCFEKFRKESGLRSVLERKGVGAMCVNQWMEENEKKLGGGRAVEVFWGD